MTGILQKVTEVIVKETPFTGHLGFPSLYQQMDFLSMDNFKLLRSILHLKNSIHKYFDLTVINRSMEGDNQQFRITTFCLFCLENSPKQMFAYLYKTHAESAHLSKLIHRLKAMVHRLC